MDITVTDEGTGRYSIRFDGTEVQLDGRDIRELLVQVTGVLAPSSDIARQADAYRRDFTSRLVTADDVGIQALLHAADHDDVVVLLKIAENDDALREKLEQNMSEKSRKMCWEDLDFRFKEPPPPSLVNATVDHLKRIVEELEDDGRPVF